MSNQDNLNISKQRNYVIKSATKIIPAEKKSGSYGFTVKFLKFFIDFY